MVKLFGKTKKKDDSPNAIDQEFQSVLDEIGVPESEKKQLMATTDINRKQQLIQSYQSKLISKKDFSQSKKKKKNAVSFSPQYFFDGLKADPNKDLLTSLRVRLGNQPLKWLKEFISIKGVDLLISVLQSNEIKAVKGQDEFYKLAQCLHSLKLIMNTKVGLESVIKVPNSIRTISLALDTPHVKTKIMVSELLSALCVLHQKGHDLVLDGMDNYREVKREKKPFIHLIQGLKNPPLQAVTFALINTLISSSNNVEQRVRVRNQFKKIGLQKIIEELEPEYLNNPDLATQRDLYEQESRWDDQEQIENARGDISDDNPDSLFRMLKDRTNSGPLNASFVSILKLLLRQVSDEDTTDEQNLSSYLFFEKILTKITETGEIPTGDTFSFGSGTLDIDHVSGEKAVLIQKEIEDLKKQKKKDQEMIHEKDILLSKLARRLKKIEDAIKSGKSAKEILADNELDEFSGIGTSPSTMLLAANSKNTSPLGITKSISSTSISNKMDFARAKAPTGQSDFLSGLNMDDSSNQQSADILPVGAAGGPPPPPPPPGMKAPATPERCSHPPSVKMKSYQWSRYRTRNIQNTFWTKVDHKKYQECLPYNQIESLFAAAIIEKKEKEVKKGMEVTLIDPKRAQNIGILLSRFKNFTTDQIYDAILNLDEKILDLETINQLVKYIPSKEEIDTINQFKELQLSKPDEERLKMGKPETFIDKISSIPRLSQRIQALHFKLNFPEKLYHAKPDIRKFNEAMGELQNNNLFSVLEIILSLGNFINYGTNRGNASGFTIDSINKLADTKSNVREKYNLVHYIIELLESTQPELLTFADEIPNVIEAATLSFSQSHNEIRLLRAGIIKLEKEIFGSKKPEEKKEEKPVEDEAQEKENDQGEEEEENKFKNSLKKKSNASEEQSSNDIPPLDDTDPFRIHLSEFLLASKTELLDAENLVAETEAIYQKIAKFFGEDPSKIPQEEFLAIFKRFADTFQLSKKDLEREKSLAERAEKRKEKKSALKGASQAIGNAKNELKNTIKKRFSSSTESSPKNSDKTTPSTNSSMDDEDQETIRSYMKSLKEEGSPSTGDASSEGEGMMDDVLNLIRDGDFRTIRRNRMMKSKPKPKPVLVDLNTPSSTYSSISSIYDAEPLEMDSEDDEEVEDEEEEDQESDELDSEYSNEEQNDELQIKN
ncbi:actin binding protein [Tieghemostelium lacteum]|uniref:Actin binding protein n=1 Tax=Tieghemostelium lacteum TaxID=361077 RepID=A0A151ZIW1_TIELA|nr:actin binding protein [Tieghemostelium lacteum]|eukprot:KYQ93845.1 actin binding protein [Tieghemostelium lacteum]